MTRLKSQIACIVLSTLFAHLRATELQYYFSYKNSYKCFLLFCVALFKTNTRVYFLFGAVKFCSCWLSYHVFYASSTCKKIKNLREKKIIFLGKKVQETPQMVTVRFLIGMRWHFIFEAPLCYTAQQRTFDLGPKQKTFASPTASIIWFWKCTAERKQYRLFLSLDRIPIKFQSHESHAPRRWWVKFLGCNDDNWMDLCAVCNTCGL